MQERNEWRANKTCAKFGGMKNTPHHCLVGRATRQELASSSIMEDDEIRDKKDHDELMEELADEFLNGDPDDALSRLEDLGYDIDDLPL